MTQVFEICDSYYNIYTETEDGKIFLTEAFVKADNQKDVHYLIHRSFAKPSVAQVVSLAKQKLISPRPYQLGQACDGSITSCVLALFHSFCLYAQLEPVVLHREAYLEREKDDFQDLDFSEILPFANWQGVEYPTIWGEEEYKGLQESLTEINYHSLANILDEVVDFSSNKSFAISLMTV